MPRLHSGLSRGYTLVELIVVIIIISVIAAVAMKSMRPTTDTARTEKTLHEMDILADAIVGDPSLISGGLRTDYGYVGDVGALPPGLKALVENPGGYATWDGPYLRDEFYSESGSSASEYATDAWGRPYAYSGGLVISTGGISLSRRLANSVDDLLYNHVRLSICDWDNTPPGNVYRDSVTLVLICPDGVGGYRSSSRHPSAGGSAQFDSIPIGQHRLLIVYQPTADTTMQMVNVDPGSGYCGDLRYHASVWSDSVGSSPGPSGLQYVLGSAAVTGPHCDQIEFEVYNAGSAAVTISSITLTWSAPTAYYTKARWDGSVVFNSNSPRAASGAVTTFGNPQSIAVGDTVLVSAEHFCTHVSGSCGDQVNMGGVAFQVRFSDGSSVTFATGACGG